MKLRLALAFVLLATSALAEDAPAISAPIERPAPAATPAPAKYYLEIDQTDLGALSQALNELPKRIADPLILKLDAQIRSQQEPIKAAAETEKAHRRR